MASSALCAPAAAVAACPNEDVRIQQGSQHLPDCRAYEQISPVDKAGYNVGDFVLRTDAHIGRDGERVSWRGLFPLPGAQGSTDQVFVGERSTDGRWGVSAALPRPNGVNPGAGLVDSEMISLGGTPDQRVHLYVDRYDAPTGWLWVLRADGTRQRIVPASSVGLATMLSPGSPFVEGVSEDGRRVLFTLTDRVGPAAGLPGSERILYEWIDDGSDGGQGTLRVVNRTNDPTVTLLDDSNHAALGGATSSDDRATFVPYGLQGAMSSDGSRIFFQNPAPTTDTGGGGALYLREDGETTILLSAPAQGHTPSGAVTSVKFLAATRDGSRAFFYADRDLVPGAPANGGLYRYDVGALTPLTFLTSTGQMIPNVGIGSEDGTRVYYERRNGGSFDIYVNVDGEDRLVLPEANFHQGFRMMSPPAESVSPDGRYLVFRSTLGATRGIHRYDAESGEVEVVASGGSREFSSTSTYQLPRRTQSRSMSDDGRFVFFDTTVALKPSDVNGSWDTYRWSSDDDRVELVSDGREPTTIGNYPGASFVGTDATGSTALVVTSARLANTDRDDLWDLYAVRVNGGRLVDDVSAVCSADGCQGEDAEPELDRAASGVVRSNGDARPARARAVRSVALVGPRGSVRVGSAGRVSVTVRAVRSGRVSAVLLAGGHTVGRSARRVGGAGRAVLSVRLSNAGRRALVADGRLRVRIVVRAGGQARSRSVVLIADRGGRRAGGR